MYIYIYQSEYILVAFFADRASQMVCTAPSIVTAKSILSPFLGRCPAHLKKAETDDKAGWFAEKKVEYCGVSIHGQALLSYFMIATIDDSGMWLWIPGAILIVLGR